jgi:hypothetical protein
MLIQTTTFDICTDCEVQSSLTWALTLAAIALAFAVAGGISRSRGKLATSRLCFLVAAALIVAAYQFG